MALTVRKKQGALPAGAAENADALNAVKAFGESMDFNALRLAAMQSFLGITSGTTTADDASLILAGQVFGA